MLKWLLWIAAVPVATALLVYAVGALLPADHVARAEASITAPYPLVAELVRDVERQPRWRRGVTAIEVIERSSGRLRYVEHSGQDAIPFHFVEEEPGRRFRSTIADPDLPFGGAWTITLAPESGSTRVRIEERGTVRSPVYRFFSALVFGHETTMKAYLDDLGRASASSAAPSGPSA